MGPPIQRMPYAPSRPATASTPSTKKPKTTKLRIPKYLDEKEARALLTTPYPANIRDRAILGLMLSTGLRASEVIGVIVKDFDFEGRILKVEKHDDIFDEKAQRELNGGDPIGPKGGKPRTLPIDPDLVEPLKKVTNGLSPNDRLFAMNRRTLGALVERYAKRAGIKKKVHPHILRHTFAVSFLKSGGDIRRLQLMLGHSRLDTTAIYLQFFPKDLNDAYLAARPKYMQKET